MSNLPWIQLCAFLFGLNFQLDLIVVGELSLPKTTTPGLACTAKEFIVEACCCQFEGIIRSDSLVHQRQELYKPVLVSWREGAEGVFVKNGSHVDTSEDGVWGLKVNISFFSLS